MLPLAGCEPRDRSGPGLYAGYCARCHGEPGEGPKRRSRTYPHTDLRASPMVRSGDREAIRRRIAEGHGPMPGFARRLTPEELDRLVDFILRNRKTGE